MTLIKNIKNKISYIYESSIDFAKDSLPLDIWNLSNGVYVLRPEVKKMVIEALKSYKKYDLLKNVANLDFIGSSTTNTYDEDSDIDIHITLKKDNNLNKENLRKEVMKYFKDNRDKMNWYINKHPLEVYIQDNPKGDYTSDGIYDILNNKWIKKSKPKEGNYNPYEIFKDIEDTIRDLIKDTDLTMGELRRDILDFEYIEKFLPSLPRELQLKLKNTLKEKLKDIEDNIIKLSSEKEEWKTLRRKYSEVPSGIEDIDKWVPSKKWTDTNAVYKFLYSRYMYGKLISKLEDLSDEGLKINDVKKIKNIMNTYYKV